MRNKRGDEKYYILISLILGLMILAISLSWIFQEYFNSDDLDYEACKQSIVFRANAPEVKLAGITFHDFSNDFPLKCKTKVVEIGKDDLGDIDNIIGRQMSECWALFGNGDSNPFPSNFYDQNSVCVPCARIHLTKEAKGAMGDNFDLREALDSGFNEKSSYFVYLNNSGRLFSAFSFGEAIPFKFEGTKLQVNLDWDEKIVPGVQGERTITKSGDETSVVGVFGEVILPKYFDKDSGDLIISHGAIVSSGGSELDYTPYLFYFQTDRSEDWEQLKSPALVWGLTGFDPEATESLCNIWDGTPA